MKVRFLTVSERWWSKYSEYFDYFIVGNSSPYYFF